MKHIDELEKMTLWDVATNEGALTQLVLSWFMFTLFVAYSLLWIYYEIKFFNWRLK